MDHVEIFQWNIRVSIINLDSVRGNAKKDFQSKWFDLPFSTQLLTNHFDSFLQSYSLLVDRFCHEDYDFEKELVTELVPKSTLPTITINIFDQVEETTFEKTICRTRD